MTRMITIHDIETGEVIEREMTPDEIKADDKKIEQNNLELLAQEKQEIAQAKAKADLLAKLGLTEDEAKLLLS